MEFLVLITYNFLIFQNIQVQAYNRSIVGI